MNEPLPQYEVAHLQETLAQDPRTAELGIHVRIRGHEVFLQGRVASAEVRDAAGEIVAARLPDARVHNDLQVHDASAAARSPEELS
jgi:osmotically-inducible protein OsmY